MCIRKRRERNNQIDSNQMRLNDKYQQVLIDRRLHAGGEVCCLRLPCYAFCCSPVSVGLSVCSELLIYPRSPYMQKKSAAEAVSEISMHVLCVVSYK